MALLEPGFSVAAVPPRLVGRIRPQVAPEIDAAVDAVLGASEVDVVEVALSTWTAAASAGRTILEAEAWAANSALLESSYGQETSLGADVSTQLEAGAHVSARQVNAAWTVASNLQDELSRLWTQVDVLALPTLSFFPPRFDQTFSAMAAACNTRPVNLAGVPALALPVPTSRLPASLQLIGAKGSEEALLALGTVIEAAATSLITN
jgi:Asp-tRNA(Asn)/Glu-tRNA(Gln) amidotransferase A subunit family amidase